jgi:SCY1-like protein 2
MRAQVATLAVHDEIGKKIDIEAIATLILPQLWAMVRVDVRSLRRF